MKRSFDKHCRGVIYCITEMEKTNQSQCIIFFVKAPVYGTVKTRMAEHTGAHGALMLYKAFAADTLATLKRMDLPLRIFYQPAGHAELVRGWLGNSTPLIAQKGATLGERMHYALCSCTAEGFDSIILVGSDIPDLNENIINQAFLTLQTRQAVIGPAADGGYYLIGARKTGITSKAFEGIDWGSPEVFEKTLQRLRENGIEPGIITELRDIDTGRDLQALAEDICARADTAARMKHTREVLENLKII